MDKERVMFFIDGSNFYKNCRNATGCSGKDYAFLDYFGFCSSLLDATNQKLIRVYLYDAPLKAEWDAARYSIQQSYFSRLRSQKNVELRLGRLEGRYPNIKEKGVDILLSVDMIKLAHNKSYDTGYLISSDGDFSEAVQLCKDMGVNINNVYLPGFKSFHLMQTCDQSIEAPADFIRRFQLPTPPTP